MSMLKLQKRKRFIPRLACQPNEYEISFYPKNKRLQRARQQASQASLWGSQPVGQVSPSDSQLASHPASQHI
jgi:hypothetical protein